MTAHQSQGGGEGLYLSAMLEHDRTKVAECLTRVKNELHSYDWLITSRGSYEWNDDKWHEEFRRASEAIWRAIEPMVKIAEDWKGCPTTPEAIAASRAPQAGEPLEQVIARAYENGWVPLAVYEKLKQEAGESAGLREAQKWLASQTPRPEVIAVSSTVWGIKYQGSMICAPTIEEAVETMRLAQPSGAASTSSQLPKNKEPK